MVPPPRRTPGRRRTPPVSDLHSFQLGPVLFRVVQQPQGDRAAGRVRDGGHVAIVPRAGICAGYHPVPGEGITPA